jgi:excinuclease UvrABC nuclease subunit
MLEGILKSMHKGIRHVGKVPNAQRSGRTVAEKIRKLQEELEHAVAVEDFERAAVLRDEIKRIRTKLMNLKIKKNNLLDFLTPSPEVAKREVQTTLLLYQQVRLARNLKNFRFLLGDETG